MLVSYATKGTYYDVAEPINVLPQLYPEGTFASCLGQWPGELHI